MHTDIRARVLREAEHIAESGDTVRKTAAQMGISKSTVHKDMTRRLKELDSALYSRVSEVLAHNKSLRHIRGGMATRKKYLLLREAKRLHSQTVEPTVKPTAEDETAEA